MEAREIVGRAGTQGTPLKEKWINSGEIAHVSPENLHLLSGPAEDTSTG